MYTEQFIKGTRGRSPRGERGLKYLYGSLDDDADEVAPLAGSVD